MAVQTLFTVLDLQVDPSVTMLGATQSWEEGKATGLCVKQCWPKKKYLHDIDHFHKWRPMGPLHDPVTWYKIIYTGEQVTQWDFQNKGRSRWTGTSCIVLEVPLRNLLTSIYNFVPCDWVVQRAHYKFSCHCSIKISLTDLILKLIIQKKFYSETRLVRLI